MAQRGFGVAAGLDPEVASPLAGRCQELGYDSVWSNDTPLAEGLKTLAEFAKGADRVELGVTIAVDRHGPAEIAADLDRNGLDHDRLWLAIGAGTTKKPLTTMRGALPQLRQALPGIRLMLAAMGPRMCAFGGEAWDGVFFNWITPGFAAESRKHVEAGAKDARRETPPVFGYVRTAVGNEAEERLAKEELFYRDLHKGYRDHFDRLDEPEGTVGIAAENAGEAQSALSEYRALDTVVVRALASAKLESMGALAEAAAPGV
jgi:alkanesulfonate monooxygenase SsuD/methylene tetrahydromethanopterin reductase-like flavin-dependent oxidoreductase (luciferase family)